MLKIILEVLSWFKEISKINQDILFSPMIFFI